MAALSVEHLKVLSSPLPYGRAPKGPYQSSPLKGPLPYGRACFRILNSRACFRILMVEHLKVQFTY